MAGEFLEGSALGNDELVLLSSIVGDVYITKLCIWGGLQAFPSSHGAMLAEYYFCILAGVWGRGTLLRQLTNRIARSR